jgi:hypothetical protein
VVLVLAGPWWGGAAGGAAPPVDGPAVEAVAEPDLPVLPVVPGQTPGQVFGQPPSPGALLAGAGGSWVDWRLPGGQVLTEVAAAVERVQGADGWGLVDPDLVAVPGGWSPRRSGFEVVLSGGGEGPVAAVAADGVVSELFWDGGPLPEPVVQGPWAQYRDLVPGVDLVVGAGPSSVQYAWRFRRQAAGLLAAGGELALRLVSDGTAAQSSASAAVVLAPGPDEGGAGPQQQERERGQWLVAQGWHDSAGGGDVAVVADGDSSAPGTLRLVGQEVVWSWPADPLGASPVFPVHGRSAQWIKGRSYWYMVWSNGMRFVDHPSEHARVGYDGWSTAKKASRSFFRFDTSALAGSHVDGAQFWHAQIHSPQHACRQGAWGAAVQWSNSAFVDANAPGWPGPALLGVQSSSTFAHGHSGSCPGDTRQAWDATALVRYAADNSVGWLSSALHSADEGDREGWRQYDNRWSTEACTDQGGQWEGNCAAPRLRVLHRPRPAAPASVAVADAWPDPAGAEPGLWLGVRHQGPAGLTASAVLDTAPAGQVQPLHGHFYFQTSTGANLDGRSSAAVPAGATASAALCTAVPCLGHGGSYRLQVYTLVDPGAQQLVAAAAPVAVRADLQAPARPQVQAVWAGPGLWRVVLTNPDRSDYNLRRLSLGFSQEGLYEAPLTDAQLRAYRDTGTVEVQVPADGPVATWYAQSWDLARNPSPVGSATAAGPRTGPGAVWPLDGDGACAVPGCPGLDSGGPWTAGRWAGADRTDRALAAGGTATTSTAPPADPAQGFAIAAWTAAGAPAGTWWTYGPPGAATVQLSGDGDGGYTAVLATGDGPVQASAAAPAPPLAAGWVHATVWYDPAAGRFGITLDGARTVGAAAGPPPAGTAADRFAVPAAPGALDQATITAGPPDRYYLAALAGAGRPDYRAGGTR